ncbi:MAG: 2,3-bisphosphoglycerate-independent phosphoglycerate mutase [Thermomicrobiales bacterium]|nr:2,3-bisphosphoglycerate-independent phosphoglycerate mutase [Thermomicrobiales bacterium]
MSETKTPVLLAILDGWGIGKENDPGNAVALANTPNMDVLMTEYPHATLLTSGENVGLPHGQMGNSEVGHLNIGAGFIVYQWITRIDKAIEDGSFQTNPVLQRVFQRALANDAQLHLLGLIGEGGVHAHTRHLVATIQAAFAAGLHKVLVHGFTDGRDTSPTSAIEFVKPIEEALSAQEGARIATLIGRYFSMDRDHRWEREAKAFNLIVHAEGTPAASADAAIHASYDAGVTDEFMEPAVILDADGNRHTIGPNDEFLFFNFRSDRGRELSEALTSPTFTGFDRGNWDIHHHLTTMTTYEESLTADVIFPPQDVEYPLARVISEAGKTQFHSAETEKYPHVTFFINGGREEPFPGETRRLVASPKVATYDLQPEMSAPDVCQGVVDAILSREYDVIIVNFANGDMVGHTGVIPAVVSAVETVDGCVGRITAALAEVGGVGIFTADHGNAEEEINPETGGPMTAHTTNPVPLVLFAPEDSPLRYAHLRAGGILSALAPTVLDLAGIPIPDSMTQASLIVRD